MSGSSSWALPLLLLAGASLAHALRPSQGDLDFAFEPDVDDDFRGLHHAGPHRGGGGGGVPLGVPSARLTQRQWGVPDAAATVGRLFRFAVPSDAFSGDVDHYEAQGPNGDLLPSWLLFDQTTGLFEGVPTPRDVGTVFVTVHAVSAYNSAKDKFSIDVLAPTEAAPSAGVVPLALASHHHPKVKCGPGEDPLILSVVMDVEYDHLKPRQRITTIDNLSGFLSLSHDLFQLCPYPAREDILSEESIVMMGEGNVKKRKWNHGTSIFWQVGCENQLWPQHTRIVNDLKQQARDGTLAEVTLWPIVGWHIKLDNTMANRGRREASGQHEVTEPMIDATSGSSISSTSDIDVENIDIRESTEKPVTIVDVSDLYDPLNLTSTSHPPTVPSTVGTTIPTTPPPPPTTTTTQATTTTTEVIELDQKNFPPIVNVRLRKLPITAGKILKHVVPDDTFKDLEEGTTRNLRLALKTTDGNDLDQTSWIQFNAARREILLLPLEEHVSKWFFLLEATDKEGASVTDKLEVIVQHHQHRRAVNHEITLIMEPTALLRQEKVLQWEVVLVESLARLFGDPDTSQITVRRLDLDQLSTNGSISLTFTNDSLPRTVCPTQGIQDMLKVLRRNEEGDPSQGLFHALTVHAKHLNIRKVLYKGLANCEVQTKPESQPGPPISTDVEKNYPPIPRNQVDHINATVGMLLNYKVPEDSFYDPEDGTVRSMKLSLLTMDHSPIPSDNWLQFDIRNQEFYGVPMPSDEGSKEYQLVCEDREGLRAHDGLVVVVHPAPRVQYSVEFSITINPRYETFIRDTQLKRKFVEKLRDLFEDSDTSNIVIGRIYRGSTVITWYNRTLPTTKCPHAEISTLRKVLVNDENQMSHRLISVMGPEFVVLAVGLYPSAVCQGELTPLHPTDPPPPPVDEFTPMGTSDDYLITFIVPAVIICTMLLLAGVVACVLYRRRRTGKMSVGDEDERQSFRNKGIPVIFQDELEDQTEPINKSPVIMKEEKPPLPPPEYQRHNPSPPPTQALLSDAEDAEPYQPPPPFTTSRDTARHTRHKSTPTYRKPPPYVPP